MNHLLVSISIVALILWTVFVNVGQAANLGDTLKEMGATELDDGTVIVGPTYSAELINTCRAKGDATLFTYKHRDKITEELALQVLERDYNDTWKAQGVSYASYIDMQRIIRDAYRTDSQGNFQRTESGRFYTEWEIDSCLHHEY